MGHGILSGLLGVPLRTARHPTVQNSLGRLYHDIRARLCHAILFVGSGPDVLAQPPTALRVEVTVGVYQICSGC